MSESLGSQSSPEAVAESEAALKRPEQLDAIQRYTTRLNKRRVLSFVERLVQAGISELLITGEVTQYTLEILASTYYGAPYPLSVGDDATANDEQALNAVDDALRQLDQLAHNILPADPEYGVDRRNTINPPQWLWDVMHVVGDESAFERISDDELIELLPSGLLDHLQYQLERGNYGSPEAIGYSLETPHSGSSGLGFGGNKQSVYFANAVATALLYSVECFAPLAQSNQSGDLELGFVQLWTKILKGYVYAWAQRPVPHQVFTDLLDNPDIVSTIKDALTRGIATGKSADKDGHVPTPQWSGQVNQYSNTIHKLVTSDILQQLDAKLAEARKDRSYGPPM